MAGWGMTRIGQAFTLTPGPAAAAPATLAALSQRFLSQPFLHHHLLTLYARPPNCCAAPSRRPDTR